ncbi:MAG TPA: CoA-binding protein, partial [Smithellaceae bacterium]|nr:CoA-binding protein [Smithellaceae bacterium]
MGDLFKMLNPRTVALIGATEKKGSFGKALFDNLRQNRGINFFPINNKRSSLNNLPCHSSILDISEHIDLAVIVIPAAAVPAVVEECGRAGVDGVVIVSSGFGETGAGGRELERQIVTAGRNYGMRIVGPGSLGIMRTNIGLNATTLSTQPESGNIAFIAHTGNFPR